jgi:hypothetical protein
MDDFDERHYFAPRIDRTPGRIYSRDELSPRLSPKTWGALIALAIVLLTALWATGCDGGVWCSR